MNDPLLEPTSPNPYEAPVEPGAGARSSANVPRERPVSTVVFGVLNIVFGLLGLCGLMFSTVVLFVDPKALETGQPNPAMDALANNPGYRAFMIGMMTIGFVFLVVGIVAGINLLRGKRSGRTLSIAYAIYSIVSGVVGAIVNLVMFIWPAVNEFGAGSPVVVGAIAGAIGGLVGLIYPILLWYFMTRRHVIAWLDAQ